MSCGNLARRFAMMVAAFFCAGLAFSGEPQSRGPAWPRHAIDDSSRGADGVRLSDVNGDALPDVTTGWEQGGVTRVYLHPGYPVVRQRWPAVTVGSAPNVEDAVFVDLDGDGRIDVVSSCEGGTQTMFVHWAPGGGRVEYLQPSAWKTEPLGASSKRMRWMFSTPMQVDGRRGVDLVAAAKGPGARIGWFESPEDPRALDQWKWHPIAEAGWIMSLRTLDMDGDGDLDVVTSDRKGPLRGCRWLENPGPRVASTAEWKNHFIGGRQHEVMFLTVADLDEDGHRDLLAATKDDGILWLRSRPDAQPLWEAFSIDMPGSVGTGKGVGVGDIDLDRRPDVVFTCENARDGRSGVVWLSYENEPTETIWTAHEISGPEGVKYDRLELLDLDGDGDLDVLTCEESEPVGDGRPGLGVFWYENRTVGGGSTTTRGAP